MNRAHPAEHELERFLCGETSREEKRELVRHLLAGCRQCAAALQPVWGPQADRQPRREREG